MGNSSLQSFRAFLHSYHCSSERSQLLFWFYVFPFLCFFSYLFIYLFPHFFSPVSVSVDVREQVRVLQMVSRGVLLLLRAIQGRSFEFRAMPFLSWRLFFFFLSLCSDGKRGVSVPSLHPPSPGNSKSQPRSQFADTMELGELDLR